MSLPPENITMSAGGAPNRKKARSQFRQELTEEQQEDIKEAFDLFDTHTNGYITL